jgi:hypothetical protein
MGGGRSRPRYLFLQWIACYTRVDLTNPHWRIVGIVLFVIGMPLVILTLPNQASHVVHEGTFDPNEYGWAVQNIHLDKGDYIVWVEQVERHDAFLFSSSPWLNGSYDNGSEGFWIEDEGTTTDFEGVRYVQEMGFWVDEPNRYDIDVNAQREMPDHESLSIIVQKVATNSERFLFGIGTLLVILAGATFLSLWIFRPRHFDGP